MTTRDKCALISVANPAKTPAPDPLAPRDPQDPRKNHSRRHDEVHANTRTCSGSPGNDGQPGSPGQAGKFCAHRSVPTSPLQVLRELPARRASAHATALSTEASSSRTAHAAAKRPSRLTASSLRAIADSLPCDPDRYKHKNLHLQLFVSFSTFGCHLTKT